MVKHIVLWNLKDENKDKAEEIKDMLQKKFKALLGVVEGLKEIEVGVNYKDGDYDIALYCVLTSKEAEAAYQTHPEHVKIKEIIKGLVTKRTAMDYEI